jgi:hypothetical protein
MNAPARGTVYTYLHMAKIVFLFIINIFVHDQTKPAQMARFISQLVTLITSIHDRNLQCA